MVMKTICVVAMLAACGGSKDPAASAQGSAAKASETKAADPDGRPAGISAEMKETLDLYVAAFEKLAAELAAAAPDCAKAVAAAERNAKELDALDARGAAMRAQMEGVRDTKSPEYAEWFVNTYAARVKGAVVTMGPLVAACEGDPALKATMDGVMSRYPMMRKKQQD